MRQDNLLGQIWVLWKKSAVHKTSLSNQDELQSTFAQCVYIVFFLTYEDKDL